MNKYLTVSPAQATAYCKIHAHVVTNAINYGVVSKASHEKKAQLAELLEQASLLCADLFTEQEQNTYVLTSQEIAMVACLVKRKERGLTDEKITKFFQTWCENHRSRNHDAVWREYEEQLQARGI